MFKAAILYNKENIKIKKISHGKLKRGQILVKIIYSGVCRSQVMEYYGERGKDKYLPHLLGHEASAIVVNKHYSVKKVKINDKVILTWIKSKGINAEPFKFSFGNTDINSGGVTTFSEYSIVSENRLVLKPPGLPDKFAPLYGCAFLTGAGIVINKLKNVSKNKFICVYGLGGIGISTLIALKSLKYKNVAVIEKDFKKIIIARKLGFKKIYNVLKKKDLNEIKKIDGKVDISIEAGGSVQTIEKAFKILNKKGKLYFSSHPNDRHMIKIKPHDLISGKKIYGSWGGYCKPDRDIKKIFKIMRKYHSFIERNGLKLYRLNDISKALIDLKNHKVLRPIIKM